MPQLHFSLYDRNNNAVQDITNLVSDKQVTRRMSRPATARGRIASRLANNLSCGDKCLRVHLDDELFFNGIVWFIDDDGDENTMYTDFIAADPMIWTRYRMARDDDGDYSDPFFFRELINGPTILQHLLDNTLQYDDVDDPLPIGASRPFFGITTSGGSFPGGGASMAGAPADWPATIADIIKIMSDTGEFDCWVQPVDETAGLPDYVMGRMMTWNGNMGSDLSGSSVWNFATGNKNVRHIKRTLDMTTIGNAIRYLLGPKLDIQHWVHSIDVLTADLPNSAFIQGIAAASRDLYGEFDDIHIYDAMESESSVRHLYNGLFELETLLRIQPREMVDITPIRGVAPNFDLGDIIAFNAGSVARGGFSGEMRVYEYTLSEDVDGVFAIDKIVASADQESDA